MQRLLQQRFFDTAPCILVTAKGVPDLATRRASALGKGMHFAANLLQLFSDHSVQ